ncbi:hypothetical protein RND81_05G179500 [Saponaria officinalis]|uniref:Uncharacterized protein n=1 Tax=Saponaria officinalis TaxID=3572 RepID=A0AAW1L243_SAPOF
MKKIEYFYQNLRHEDSMEEQIAEAQEIGIITSYFLTTKSAMNARRITEFCMWCDAIWSTDHHCEHAPESNCMFTFGEDGEGVAFVMVTKEGLKRSPISQLQNEALPHHENGEVARCTLREEAPVLYAHKVFGEMSEPTSSSDDESFESSNEVLTSVNGDDSSEGYKNGESQVNDQCLQPNSDLLDEVALLV